MTRDSAAPVEIRDIETARPEELDAVTHLCIATVLETIPELGGRLELAEARLPNFGFEKLRAMIQGDFGKPTHRCLVAVDQAQTVRAYCLFSARPDAHGVVFGNLFSLGVARELRRRGTAVEMLRRAEAWVRSRGAVYARAETHVQNGACLAVAASFGGHASEPVQGPWPYVVVTKRFDV